MHKRLLHIFILFLWIVTSVHAQKYEYWLDDGYNHRTISAYNGGDIINNIDVRNLIPGLHFYNIRIQYGSGQWGPVNRILFIIAENAIMQLSAVEYWIDEQTSITQKAYGSTVQISEDISLLNPGTHLFNCRVKDNKGIWSEVYSEEFTIDGQSEPATEEAFIEYFFDSDPGYGKGSIVRNISTGDNSVEIDLANLDQGAYTLYVRSYDGQGHWSSTASHPLYVRHPVNVTAAEYFIDTDNGIASATAVNLPENPTEPFDIVVPTAELSMGEHLFGLRVKGNDGIWTYTRTAIFTLVKTPGDVNGDNNVDATDVTETEKYILGVPLVSFNKDAADVNGDGVVNAADIVEIVKIIKANK